MYVAIFESCDLPLMKLTRGIVFEQKGPGAFDGDPDLLRGFVRVNATTRAAQGAAKRARRPTDAW